MVEERRKTLRRENDRELLDEILRLSAQVDRRLVSDTKESKRDRRRAIRHNCRISMRLVSDLSEGIPDTPLGSAVDILKGRVLDLSTDGASVLTKQPSEAGQALLLAIQVRDGNHIQCHAEVRWVKVIPEKKAYAWGLRFTDCPASGLAQIKSFLEALDAGAGL